MLKLNKTKYNLTLLVNICLVLYILLSIYISFRMILLERSLWYDEAMFSFSFTKRNLFNLTSSPFEWDQTAPIIYIYIVKIITLIFNNTEISLRIWSFISFLISLWATFYISKSILHIKYSLYPVALLSSLSIMLLYANEFKTYMFDSSIVLLIIILFYLYSRKKISRSLLNILLMLSIWASNPVCFFIASFLILEFIEALRKKDYKKIKNSILSVFLSLISFICYFFYWLKPVIDKGFMSKYWKHKQLNLLPSTYEDILSQFEIIKELFTPFHSLSFIIVFTVVCGLFINIWLTKNRYITAIYVGLIITLIASCAGMFPLQDRMCLFMYPLFVILFFFTLNQLFVTRVKNFIIICIYTLILFSTSSIRHYRNLANTYKYFQEFNESYNYVLANVKENDKVYFSFYATPALCYKNDYDTLSIGGYTNNISLGKSRPFLPKLQEEEAHSLINEKRVFIVQVHTNLDILLETFEKYGSIEKVHEFHHTPVFLYQRRDSVYNYKNE